jgi:hypothetical protein
MDEWTEKGMEEVAEEISAGGEEGAGGAEETGNSGGEAIIKRAIESTAYRPKIHDIRAWVVLRRSAKRLFLLLRTPELHGAIGNMDCIMCPSTILREVD